MENKNRIEQLEKELARLRQLVYYDELTGVFNRRGFQEEAGRDFIALTYGRPEDPKTEGEVHFSVLFLDVDDFKKINDTHGHDVGDLVLKAVAEALKEALRISDIISRWGGEEFVAALLGTDHETAMMVAERVRATIANIKIENYNVVVTASVGVAVYQGQKSLKEIVGRADSAMYKAKKNGKNQVVFEAV